MSGDLVHVPASTLPAHASSFDLAPAAWGLAQKIASTEFVSKALRGSPEKVLACMLTGNELGIGPMNALSKIHIIEGKPGAAAELMRALILRDGHEFWIDESTNTKCRVGIRRAGSSRDQMFEWTMDDARRAKLAGKQVWQSYPRAMLLARVTAEAARAVCPDSIAGMSYTVEELSDGDVVDADDVRAVEAVPSTAKRSTAKATRAATAPAAVAAAPVVVDPVEVEVPPLPGEEDELDPRAVVLAELAAWAAQLTGDRVEQWAQWKTANPGWHKADDLAGPRAALGALLDAEYDKDDAVDAEPGQDDGIIDAELVDESDIPAKDVPADVTPDDGPAPRLISDAQRRTLFMHLRAAGVDNKDRKAWAAGWLNHPVESFNDLTVDEAARLIEQAEAEADVDAGPDAA